MSKGKLVVISGASGVGKGTVLGIMMKKREDLKFSVSATTRSPRPSETDGVHYYFVTKKQFEEMIATGRKYPSDKVEWIIEKYMLADYPRMDFYALCEKYFMEDGPSPVPLNETLRIMELIDLGYKQNPVIE